MKKLKKSIRYISLFITIAFASALIVAAFAGWYDPEAKYGWFFVMMAMSLPVFVFLNLITGIVWLLKKKWLIALISFSPIAIGWQSIRTVTPFHPFTVSVDKVKRDSTTLKVLTYNVMNFGKFDQTNFTPSKAMRYILDEDADIVLLQEGSQERDYMKLSQNSSMVMEIMEKYPYRTGPNHDLVIMSKYPYHNISDNNLEESYWWRGESAGHIRGVELEIHGRRILVVSVHLQSVSMSDNDRNEYVSITRNGINSKQELHNAKHQIIDKVVYSTIHRQVELEHVWTVINALNNKDVIVAGDFNETPASWCYWKARNDDRLHDAWADAGLGYINTFNDYRLLFKIDHIMYRGDLTPIAIKRDRTPGSDHYPLVAVFKLENTD